MFGRGKIRRAPSYDDHFGAGLRAKAAQDWRECVRLNKLACELFTDDVAAEYGNCNPAAWNLGIAATALGDWRSARQAWHAYGIEAIEPDGAGPIDLDLGHIPIRLNPDRPSLPNAVLPSFGETEVVWCRRRSPAHVVIDSVPLPESGHHWRDVLLNDGEPKGSRRAGGTDRPVFDELARLETSGHPTWQGELTGVGEDLMGRLLGLCSERGIGCDDWSGMRILCSDCSHGTPDAGDHVHEPASGASRLVGFAGPEGAVRDALAEWSSAHDGIVIAELERVL